MQPCHGQRWPADRAFAPNYKLNQPLVLVAQKPSRGTLMTTVDLICCPYDSGRRDWRCGTAAKRILQQGAFARIEAAGARARVIEIDTEVDYESEGALVFEAQRQIAKSVADARKAGRLPLVLGGNCNTAVGGVSGIGGPRLGVVWFDAHGDFCTPDSTDSGFLDGMGFAMMMGRCWQRILSTVPGYRPIAESAAAHVGGRSLDPWEVEDLANSEITLLRVEDIRKKGVRGAFESFLERLAREADHVYLHIDIDVHDPKEAPANHYNTPDGLSSGEVREAIALIGQHIAIAGGGISSYDPSFDPQGKTAEVAVGVLESLIAASRAKDFAR
jgi:arginase